MSKRVVARSALYLYIETFVTLGLGFVFWLVSSKLAKPDIIGLSSMVISLSGIFSIVAMLGIPIGLQRFVANSLSNKMSHDFKIFVETSFICLILSISFCGVILFLGSNYFYTTLKLNFDLIILTFIILSSSAITEVLRSIVIASLRFKLLSIIMIFAAVVRIILVIVFLLYGLGAIGVIISFSFFTIVAAVILTIVIRLDLKLLPKIKSEITFKESFKSILIASGVNYIPLVIRTIGINFGPLLVYSSIGATQAGVYFIGYSVFSALLAIVVVLYIISYPLLSSMVKGRKKFTWQMIKITLIIFTPFCYSFVFYTKQIISQIFGQAYADSSYSLEILLISIVPTIITYGITTLMNSYGKYKQVLIIGIASNIPTVILYFLLVPLYQNGVGAAISFTIGSIFGFLVSIFFAIRIKMNLFFKDMFLISVLPLGISFCLNYIQINFVLSILVTICASYFIILKSKVISKEEVNHIYEIIPSSISIPIGNIWNKVKRN